jgi:peptidoglycan/xylan/chitin deacetylase (PgdA/CDA1 family)/3D (Asp-Asp-Asp) domain-containing protein
MLAASTVLADVGPHKKKPKPPYQALGKFSVTYYWVVNENAYPVSQDAEIRNMAGTVIARVHPQFKKDMNMEGTGILRNGRTLNFAGRVSGEVRYRFTTNRWGWGVGMCALNPYKTIAVDPARIPLGTTVYIPALEGVKLPDGTAHDGLMQAEDIGGMIKEKHIDLFAQEGPGSTQLFKSAGVKSGSFYEVYKVRDADPQGCHTLPPEEGPEKSLLGSRLQALVDLADEYAEAGQMGKYDEVIQKIYELKNLWEARGRPEAHPRLHEYFLNKERRRFDLRNPLGFDLTGSKGAPPYANEVNGHSLPARQVVLTFDDGPHETFTTDILGVLAQEGMQATFFQVGEEVAKFPHQTRLAAQAGHVLGNHSYTHERLIGLKDDAVRAQIASTQDEIQRAMGGAGAFDDYFQIFFSGRFATKRTLEAPEFFRSPYGARDQRTMKIISGVVAGAAYSGHKTVPQNILHVMWNVDSLDWKDPDPKSIEARVFRVLAQQGDKGVILFHDIHPQTVEAVRLVLPRLKREGYQVVSLYDLR